LKKIAIARKIDFPAEEEMRFAIKDETLQLFITIVHIYWRQKKLRLESGKYLICFIPNPINNASHESNSNKARKNRKKKQSEQRKKTFTKQKESKNPLIRSAKPRIKNIENEKKEHKNDTSPKENSYPNTT